MTIYTTSKTGMAEEQAAGIEFLINMTALNIVGI